MYQTYTVKAGDTLWGISNQYGVSVTDLATLNNVSANNLQINQVLRIPNKEGNNPSGMIMYTVKKGDTLYQIAKKYSTSVDEIKKYNSLTNNNLFIGQVLRIPDNNPGNGSNIPNYINYIVKKGDSLYKISKEYNLTVDDIIKDNSLNSTTLSIGQNLKIRVPNNSEEVLECFGKDYDVPEEESYISYTVKKGDNLYSIARKYNTSVESIKKNNNLKSNLLSIGQILKI